MIFKNSKISFAAILFILVFISCRSSKDIMLLKNVTSGENINELNDTLKQYYVKPGDILYISIKSINPDINALFNPEMYMESQSGNSSYTAIQRYSTPQGAYLYGYEINEDGEINLPIMGYIDVEGKNQEQLQHLIQEKASFYLKDVVVKVKLLSFKVTVLGELRNPGIYYNYSNNFTILDAIAMANGHNDFANIKNVLVVRKDNNTNKTYRLNLQNGEAWKSEVFYLHPNDYIVVEPLKNKNIALNTQGFSMIISSLSMMLAIMGFIF